MCSLKIYSSPGTDNSFQADHSKWRLSDAEIQELNQRNPLVLAERTSESTDDKCEIAQQRNPFVKLEQIRWK